MEKYKFIEKLGRGTHGTVYLLEPYDKTKNKVVCKSVVEKHLNHARKEVTILTNLVHKRIIKIVEFIEIKGSSFIILEYANRGTLDTVIKFFIQKNRKATNFLLWSVLSQISEGLEYLHSKKIIHRDIKPGNLLINSLTQYKNEEILEFKICDFSLSYQTEELEEFIESSIVGTPFYMAPEMVSRKKYNNLIDVWGLGITLYELCTLRKPFSGETRKQLYSSIISKKIDSGFSNDEKLEKMILMCLYKTNRITSKQIVDSECCKYHLSKLDNKIKDLKIDELEKKVKILEKKINWPPTPN
ncbi:camk family protein kinase [Vairimorpha apis BRL 01]|uniref:non-specific serine/threonine protein kinase n=1 Tax=Vairimorpha apis BRL 01 TaxID=1037528 RepID=T0L1T6_9MICR|nr:camk family protein kinase [Vairimorpha apis BRL 01]